MKNHDLQLTDKKVETLPSDDFNRQSTPVPDPSPREEDPKNFTGSLEDSYKAATAGTGGVSDQPTGHPTEVFHAREKLGQQQDEDAKDQTKH
jgi:hypothetical protein